MTLPTEPADDQMLYDLSARYDTAIKKVERLETLEFGTTAFPSGGQIAAICDIVVAGVPVASVTFCTPPYAQTFRHLFAIMHYFSTLGPPTEPGKMELNLNGDFAGVYLNYTRQEVPVGPPFITDTEVPPIGLGTDTKITLPIPAQDVPIAVGAVETPTMCMVLLPSYSRDTNVKSVTWWGYANPETTVGANLITGDQGGGEYRQFFPATLPITSITMTHPAPGLFRPGSHFTLYGLA